MQAGVGFSISPRPAPPPNFPGPPRRLLLRVSKFFCDVWRVLSCHDDNLSALSFSVRSGYSSNQVVSLTGCLFFPPGCARLLVRPVAASADNLSFLDIALSPPATGDIHPGLDQFTSSPWWCPPVEIRPLSSLPFPFSYSGTLSFRPAERPFFAYALLPRLYEPPPVPCTNWPDPRPLLLFSHEGYRHQRGFLSRSSSSVAVLLKGPHTSQLPSFD